jgi:hypothetical protein
VPSGLVSISIESLDGTTRSQIGVRTLEALCEGLHSPDWRKLQENWKQLRGIEFPKIAGHKKVDIVVGSDHPELMLSLEERTGNIGEPTARRTPLGWTCIGPFAPADSTSFSHFAKTYHGEVSKDAHLDAELRNLWNMDVITKNVAESYTPEEKLAI